MPCVITAVKRNTRSMMIRSYSELITFDTFLDRFNYLKLNGKVGAETFGWSRYLNQAFYASPEWKKTRRRVIIRDEGCDLGLEGYNIYGTIYVHHINPITPEDIDNRDPKLFSMDNLVCVSYRTHEAITYGNEELLLTDPIIRRPNDMCPWKN